MELNEENRYGDNLFTDLQRHHINCNFYTNIIKDLYAMETYTEKLPVQLSEESKQAIAEELTQLEINLGNVKSAKSSYNKDVNEEIKELEKQALALSQQYQAEGELQEVECYFVFDEPEAGLKTIYRSDTGASVRVTDMNIFDNPNSGMPKNANLTIVQLQLEAKKEIQDATYEMESEYDKPDEDANISENESEEPNEDEYVPLDQLINE